MRRLSAVVLSVSFGLLTAAGQDKKDTPNDARAEKLKAVTKQLEGDIGGLQKKLEAARDAKERETVVAQAKELFGSYAPKALKVAEEKPDDATGQEAAILALQLATQTSKHGAEVERAADILARHHMASPKVRQLVPVLENAGEPGVKALRAFAAAAKDQQTKGAVTLALGKALVASADKVGDLKKGEALVKEAESAFETAARDYKDVRTEDSTVGREAESELKTVRAVGVGKPAPDVEGTDLDGKKVKLASFKGKVVVLDIWATWCGPCVAMIPHERELVKKLEGKPFVFLSVSADKEKQALTEFLTKTQMPWQHWWDGADRAVQKAYHVQYYPNVFIIDANGVIRYRHVRGADMDKAVEELLKEAPKGR